MKKLFLAITSLVLTLNLPVWINGESYLVLHQSNFKYLPTYTEPYHELMKKISTVLSPGQEMTVTVSAWQDSDGNMHFSDSGQQTEPDSQNYEVKSRYTGRLAFAQHWVWTTMSTVWLGFYITGLFGFNWLTYHAAQFNRRRPIKTAAHETPTQNNTHQYIDYEKVNAPKISPYKILGIKEGAALEEIKTAYRNKIKQYHPDKVAHLGSELQDVARKKTSELNRAYETLAKQK